ncbi:COP1-interacting protein 7-like isoform X2 [Tasmannia lanceolata]|uniref:COP1-interacting protein 7-like isoform X2 n=1 Tax=Tasmannia lanceolata TaxID=3420 RepID=UPI004063EB40
MKSETRLDSAVFQLTPTRTRCDLVITANGKTEKIASGLVNAFVAHLKTAQDEIAKGGYSITLEPDPGTDATWFTKGTVERLVWFVSTPELLERVNTIESEIFQIDEAISSQSNDNIRLSTVEDQPKSIESIEGSESVFDSDAEKAIVLFKPGVHPPESNGSTIQEENSKVKLLRVLETRKTVLQKEQGMAFARAVAAGFDMDHMAQLISFAECFRATRLMDACLSFVELWKGKHETGQWVEIEATEVKASQSDFSSMNASGIILTSETRHYVQGELGTESNGKTSSDASVDISSQKLTSDPNKDKRSPMDSQLPLGSHEYFQGQFHHPIYPQWPIHSPSGAPVFPPYPMQIMPYYQNYAGNAPLFQPPYPQTDDPRFNTAQRIRQTRGSMDTKDNDESETSEMGRQGADHGMLELQKEVSHGRESRRKVGRSVRKQSDTVVIQNINYISSKKQNASGSESESASEPETDEEAEHFQSNARERKRKGPLRSSKVKGNITKSSDTWNSNDGIVYGREADSENWQAFQNCLLRDDEENTSNAGRDMLSVEKEPHLKRWQIRGADPILPPERDMGEVPKQLTSEFDLVSGRTFRMYNKQKASNNELAISHEGFHSNDGRGLRDGQVDVQFTEIEGGGGGYRRVSSDDFMIYGRENQSGITNSLPDPLAGEQYGHVDKSDKSTSHNVMDESFIVPFRSRLENQVGTDSRTAIDMDSEFLSALQRTEDSSNGIGSQLSYEPDELSLMPEPGTEKESVGYDPAVDYEMQVHSEEAVVVENGNGEDIVAGVKEGSKKLDKEKKPRIQNGLEKRKMEAAIKKGKPSKLSPLAEAQVRAERLRAFKADLQKVKREKEEEQIKRLEALKRERQKRIAAKGSSNAAQSPIPSSQTKSRLPTKLSPTSLKGPKFSDSELASSSHLPKLHVKTALGSSDSQGITKPSRLNGTRLAGSRLSRSVSSLNELKRENNGVSPEPRAASTRTRRLSDPKGSNTYRTSSLKPGSNAPAPKPKVSDEPSNKKISAIMSLDRTKSATLPELKVRTSRGSSEMVQTKSVTKVIMQKGNGSRSPMAESIKPKKSKEKTSHHSNGDENPVIENTVVMLESEPVSVVQASEERMEIRKGSYDNVTGENPKTVVEYTAIHAPTSPVIISEVIEDPSECQPDELPSSHEVTADHGNNELQKFSINSASEKPYRAPYARLSSLEDPCTSNLEYSKAQPVSYEMATGTETVRIHVSDFYDPNSREQFPETLENSRGKESSKGFKRLLKFARKNHSSAAGEHSVDLDKVSIDSSAVDDHTARTASSNEVHTLKNLISQDDSPIGGTPPKVSRPFSLLSPFRSKTSEKKLTT